MIPGIVASNSSFIPSPPAGYHPVGVHFSGTTGGNGKCGISLSSLSCTDNGFSAWSGWFKKSWFPSSNDYAFMVNSAGIYEPNFHPNGTTQYEWDVGNATRNWQCNIGASDSTAFLTNNTWQHLIGACDTNHSSGTKLIKLYVDDVDSTANTSESSPAWTFIMNGKDFWLGDDGFGSSWEGDIADFSFWPGVSLLTAGDISLTTRRYFIDGSGNPVDPSVAIAALGSPAVMCSNGVTGFLANTNGTSGTLTVPGGYDSPTNSSTNP